MISVDMSVREAVWLLTKCDGGDALYERVLQALEKSCGESNINVTLRSMRPDAMIPCIKALRLATGWGLKESKAFCDVVRGKSDGYGNNNFYGGTPNTVTIAKAVGDKLAAEWKSLGCDVVTDYYNC